MEIFEKCVPCTSKITDHFQFIPFVSSSKDNKEIVSEKSFSQGNLNGEEASQFYKEVITSPSSCLFPVVNKHRKKAKVVKKAVTSVPGDNRLTIFHYAQNGNIEGIEKFLSKQCDVNTQDMYGWTPLMCATFEGHYAVAEYLMKCGANLNVKDKQGLTVFDIAVKRNNKALLELFKNGIMNESSSIDDKIQEKIKYCDVCKYSYSETKLVHERSIAHLFSNKGDNISTYYHIPENNKGFQIMLKKGWDKNKGLGMDSKGRKFPIKTVLKSDRSCIGGKKEIPKVTHFGPNDHGSIKKCNQPTLNLKREKKLKKLEAKKLERRNRQFEIHFRRQFHS